MRISTKFLGDIDIDEKDKILFPRGLFGFEQYTEFVLLNSGQPPFVYFQSVSAPNVCFILIDPFLFRPDFEADIADEEAALIGLETPEQAAALVIVTIPPEDAAGADAGAAQQATANLQGPLIINRETNTGCQIILSDPRWKTKHDITAGAPC